MPLFVPQGVRCPHLLRTDFFPDDCAATGPARSPGHVSPGSSQLAHCWLMLYQITDDAKFRDAARKANAYVRARVRVTGTPEMRGGVKGSFPVDGEYGQFESPELGMQVLH